MIGLALVLSLSGVLYALLVGIFAFVIAWVVCAVLAHAGIPLPGWIPLAVGVIVFLLALLGGVTVN